VTRRSATTVRATPEPETPPAPAAARLDVFERIRRRIRPRASPPLELLEELLLQPFDGLEEGEPGGPCPRATMHVEGETIVLRTPEGHGYTLGLDELFTLLVGPWKPLSELVLPRGTRAVRSVPGGLVVVFETPPGVHRVRWIAPTPEAKRGRGTVYREVELAFPYLILVTGVRIGSAGIPVHRGWTEAYFSNQPLTSSQDRLHYPPLLNVCRTPEGGGSVVCMQGLVRSPAPDTDDVSVRVHHELSAVVGHFLHSGFNEDFERIGRTSTFNDPRAKPEDPRLATIEDWERASAEDPDFVLDVSWVPTGRTLGDALRGTGVESGAGSPVRNARLQRMILGNGTRLAPPAEAPPDGAEAGS
jgi:hypothetical protein